MTVSQNNMSQVSTEALDRCRQAASAEAGHLGGGGDTFPDGGCPPTTFGKLGASATMAAAVDALDRRMRAEFDAAERLLRSTEQAIGAVESGVRDVDDEVARGLTGTVA